jgi:uncharacterized protein
MSTRAWRLFFSTDIHGSDLCFRKFLNAAKVYGADVLVLGGDITGKAVVPLVRVDKAHYSVSWLGKSLVVDDSTVGALEEQIRFHGFYPSRLTSEEASHVAESADDKETLFRRAIESSIKGWLSLAEEKLNPAVECYISPGNDDALYVAPLLATSSRVQCPDQQVVRVHGTVEMLSVGYSNLTPFNTPRELPEEQFHLLIDQLASQLSEMSTAIFNIHCPPYDTGLDLAPLISKDREIVSERGQPIMTSVGSTAVRKAIEQYQPALGLHGHVHESRGVARLGSTLCLNPGSQYNEGVLNGALITYEGMTLKNYQFVSA